MTEDEALAVVNSIFDETVSAYLNRMDFDVMDYLDDDQWQEYVDAYKVAYGVHPLGEEYEKQEALEQAEAEATHAE